MIKRKKPHCGSEDFTEDKECCEDFPITYCKKCGSFYVLDKEGDREEINVKVKEDESY